MPINIPWGPVSIPGYPDMTLNAPLAANVAVTSIPVTPSLSSGVTAGMLVRVGDEDAVAATTASGASAINVASFTPIHSHAQGEVVRILLATLPATLDATDNNVQATADMSAMASGISRFVLAQYRKSTNDPWRDFGSVSGTTLGGPDHDRHGNVVEWGIIVGPLPDAGLAGRQVRAQCQLGAAATLSGHVISTV